MDVTNHTPTVLTIAGFDPFGAAGIAMDLRAIHALGGYGLSALTTLTVQNSQGAYASQPVDPDLLAYQLEALLGDLHIDAVKIGMVATVETIETIARILRRYPAPHVVLDPVLVSSSGHPLLAPDALTTMAETLFPLCSLITPNLPEATALLGIEPTNPLPQATTLAQQLHRRYRIPALVKGGHSEDPTHAEDLLIDAEGNIHRFSSPRIATRHTRGTGCLLSSAIATTLAQGHSLPHSIDRAKRFLTRSLQDADRLHLPYRDPSLHRAEPIPLG